MAGNEPSALSLLHQNQQRIMETQDDHDKRLRSVEQAVVLLAELVKQDHKPPEASQSWGDVIKANPGAFVALVLGSLSIAGMVLAFAIARDPSAANRVVDKVPTREMPK